jgi:formamidopyrimidine-DNA glycosylase
MYYNNTMPELPEVETTVRGLKKEILDLKILDVWTDLTTKDKRKDDTVSNPRYFILFRKEIKNKKILSVERRAKNILINLSGNKTILIHLKMTGSLFYGTFENKYIHFIFYLSNKKNLYFSDVRKFGKITLLDTNIAHNSKHLKDFGPEPLEKSFTLKKFKERLNKKPNGKIKTTLLDQTIIAGIGNIYSDEILWEAGIHPERKTSEIKELEFKKMFNAMKKILNKSIKLGGDSISDYLNLYGLPGKFQTKHEAYQRTGKKCRKKGCRGVIMRKMINGRSSHFCSKHQI